MKNQKNKQDQGVAGLTILLSLVVMLFIIGLLIMIFSIMGSELQESSYDTLSATVVNNTLTSVAQTPEQLSVYSYRDVTCVVSQCRNATSNNIISPLNYTATGCTVKYSGAGADGYGYNNSDWKCTYTYSYSADNTATGVMNDTVSGISGTTDWFDIFIVIGAMVVLILLTVIIITAIRSSGMVESGSTSGANQVGTA